MGLAIVALGFAFGSAILVTLAIAMLGQRTGRSKGATITALVVTPVVFAASLYFAVQVLWKATTQMAIAAPPEEADNVLALVDIPPGTASDVCYRRSYVGCFLIADFQMSEEDFLAWVKDQGWTVKRFTFKEDWESIEWDTSYFNDPLSVRGEVMPIRGWERDTRHYVRDGYMHYEWFSEDSGRKIVYDLATGRVYVEIC